MERTKEGTQANGEAVFPQAEKFLYDTLTIPDLAAVEASFDRSRLVNEQGADVAAMVLDVANTIQAGNSSEKMLSHPLAAMHKVAMEMIGSVVPHSRGAADFTKTKIWRASTYFCPACSCQRRWAGDCGRCCEELKLRPLLDVL
jgi:hypothetical protein